MKRTDPSNDPAQLLTQAQSTIDYDVERGIARHRTLRADEAPLPAWAAQPAAGPLASTLRRLWPWGPLLLLGLAAVSWSAREGLDALPGVTPAQRIDRPPPAAIVTPAVDPPKTSSPGGRSSRPSAVGLSPHVEPAAATPGEVASTDEPTPPTPDFARRPPAAGTPGGHALRRHRSAHLEPARESPKRDMGHEVSETRSRAGAPATTPPQDLLEMRMVARAEGLLEGQPAEALRLVREASARFGPGYFAQERAYLEIRALVSLGRTAEARAEAFDFAHRFPDSAFRARIDRTLEGR